MAPFPDPLAPDQDAAVADALKGFDHLLKSMTAPEETAAVILEPVLGEGGYIPAPQAFLTGLVDRCREHGIMFIADEVQSGFGRTGKMFAVDHYGIEPDIICMAKGIASGFPFSALGTRRELDDKWPKGSHGGTYGGNAIGCAAALATIEVMSEPGFMENVVARGEQLSGRLRELQQEHRRSCAGSWTRPDGRRASSTIRPVSPRSSEALPRRRPPDRDERRDLRQVTALDAAARGQRRRDRHAARSVLAALKATA